jgi:type II secretory pathway pseudopilin PulG
MRRKLTLALVLLGAAAAILSSLLVRESRQINTRSVDSLQTIHSAQAAYAQIHPDRGFAPSLTELGPSSGEAMIDDVLASGRKSGYIFILSTAPPDSRGRIVHYTVVASPEKHDKGTRSLFIDESGIERFTTENRAATITDPPLK